MVAVRRLRGRDTHRRGELSYAQYGLLFGLAEHGELCATELATFADVAPSTATAMLDRLVELGLVQRVRSEPRPAHGAGRPDRPTAPRSWRRRRARYERLWDAALAEFTDEQLAGATAVLERVAAMFDEIGRDGDAPTG